MKKISFLIIASLLIGGNAIGQTKKTEKMKNTAQSEHYTFKLSDKVTRKKVSFKNRYGITLSGDLYLPKNHGNESLAALAISGPFGAVKEQSSGLYGNTMAERGFAALVFDPSYTGESGGEPRNLASPELNTEDFSAAVDYLAILPSIDKNKMGIIGICGFGGMGLSAAAADKRIKAVVTTSMYDMSRVMAHGMNDAMTKEQRAAALEKMSEQRSIDAEKGTTAPGARILPEKLTEDSDPVTKEFFDYYRTERGFHENSPNSNGAWTATTPLSFMNLPLNTYVQEISPRPILLIAGEKAHSRYFSEDLYKAAGEQKELVIIPGANHVDLYDRMNIIPFDKIEAFFNKNFNN